MKDAMTPPGAQLRVLATSDVHMHLTGWDDTSATPIAEPGLARLAPVIRSERADMPPENSLLLDNGDCLQGTPLAQTAFETPERMHPFARVARVLGYDAVGLGNHDLDFGPAFLARVAGELPCPVLSANLNGVPGVIRQTVLTRAIRCNDGQSRNIRIGLTSVLPWQTRDWCKHVLSPEVDISAPVSALADAIKALRADGADLVIAMVHSGFAPGLDDPMGEQFAQAAAALPGIDAMITGHAHQRFPGQDIAASERIDPDQGILSGRPCVMPGYAAGCLGRIDLSLVHDNGVWRLTDAQAKLLEPAPNPAPDITATLDPDCRETSARLSMPVGETKVPLHSFFALLRSAPAYHFVAKTMRDALEQAGLPDEMRDLPRLAIVAPGLTGGRAGPSQYVNLPEGPLQYRAVEALCPFQDVLAAKCMTGADLRLHLERAASTFAQTEPGVEAPLIPGDRPGFNFDAVLGLTVRIDTSRPPMFSPEGTRCADSPGRIVELSRHGQWLADDDRFVVAMNSYRAEGGGGYPSLGQRLPLEHSLLSVRRLICDALKAGAVPGDDRIDWALAPAPGTTATFDTNPGARAYLDEIAAFAPEDLGLTEDRFLRLRLHL